MVRDGFWSNFNSIFDILYFTVQNIEKSGSFKRSKDYLRLNYPLVNMYDIG